MREEIKMRPYQEDAVHYTYEHFYNVKNKNGIIILPTGSGKSIVIANIIKRINVPTLILQPSKEILVQNYKKYTDLGFYAEVFSASLGQKQVGMVTFATIGSIIKKMELFKHIKLIIIDECHGVEPTKGMYNTLIRQMKVKVIGLTATPYRLYSSMGGSELRFITRQRQTQLHDIIYLVQNRKLFDDNYLAKLRYFEIKDKHFEYDTSKMEKTANGSDYTERSMKEYHKSINFPEKISNIANRVITAGRKNALIFVRFLDEAREIVRLNPTFGYIDGEMDQKSRDAVIKAFLDGRIKVLVNSGVLTTGFDFPELECVIMGRDTLSLALYYQIVGRGIRIHKNKEDSWIIDMCKNIDRFGKVEDLVIKFDTKRRPFVAGLVNKKQKMLTNCKIY
jgi:DNA repair protein RadD